MTSQEAKEIIKQSHAFDPDWAYEKGKAEGFLEGMKSKEVQDLVKALEIFHPTKDDMRPCDNESCIAFKAIKVWKESMK